MMTSLFGRTSKIGVLLTGGETKRRAPWSIGARRDGQPALSITETLVGSLAEATARS
jgi:hypothetical protein